MMNRWTKEEIEKLKNNYAILSNRECSNLLNRSEKACNLKAFRLGLKKLPEIISKNNKKSWTNERRKIVAIKFKLMPRTIEHRNKIALALKGKKRPPEVGFKIALKLKGRKASMETKLKLSEALKGRKFTEEHKQKISQSNMGKPGPFKGKIFSKEHRKRISLAQKREKGNNWKGGIKVLHLQEWRKIQHQKRRALKRLSKGNITVMEWIEMKNKYNNICPSCRRKEPDIILTMDHIVPLSKGGKHCISNIQPLCRKCNGNKYTKTIFFSKKIENQTQLIY